MITMYPIINQLAIAAEGLFYISETDTPLTPVTFPPGKSIEDAIGAPVEIQEIAYFFRNELRDDRPDAPRFRALVELFQELLPDAKAYRTGSVQVTAYIVGRLPDGSFGGLKTELVET